MKVHLLLCFITLVYSKNEEYIGWKAYSVSPASQNQLKYLRSIVQDLNLDVLSDPILERSGVVLVQPEQQETFIKSLEDESIAFEIYSDDVKRDLDYDDEIIEIRNQESLKRNGGRQLPYDSYHQIEVINNYLDEVGRLYPDVVTVVNAAKSFEGRDIKYLKISTTNFEDTSKPIIFIDAGIHAREWIAPPTVTYAIHKLVENVTEPDLLERFDWILLPVVNPDGYKFSFTSRLWRKTRSTDQSILSFACPGVDGNRNYDFFWNTVGTSSLACSDTYGGGRAFSEVETRVVRDILHENLHRIALYLTMHSYGSMILYPWGHDGSLSGNAFALHTVGIAMAEALEEIALPNFPRYVVGNSALVIGYAASGAAEDYAHLIGVPLSYTYELPGLRIGALGFILHPRHIEQVCRETWAGIAVGARRAGELFLRNQFH